MTLMLWALQGWITKRRPRRLHLIHRRRDAARRALDWAGIGPARHSASGPVADHPYGEGDPLAPIVGIAVHAGPHLWILMWWP